MMEEISGTAAMAETAWTARMTEMAWTAETTWMTAYGQKRLRTLFTYAVKNGQRSKTAVKNGYVPFLLTPQPYLTDLPIFYRTGWADF